MHLYSSKDEMIKREPGFKGSETGGYRFKTKQLIGFYSKAMKNHFGHEGMHQFTDILIPGFNKKIPMWFSEGIAECFGNCQLRDGKLYVCAKDSPGVKEYYPYVEKALKQGKSINLKQLFNSDKNFWKQPDIYYPHSWSFCHFLMVYPEKEDKSKQIPEGKYSHVVKNLLKIWSDKKEMTHEEAYKKAFVIDDKPIDLDQLEKEWKDYMMKFNGYSREWN